MSADQTANKQQLKRPGRIILERRGTLGWITISNPDKRNAISLQMWRDLYKCVVELGADDDIRAVVVTGAGATTFTAGADIREFATVRNTPENVAAYELAVAQAEHALEALGKPSIARINGLCMGGGIGIALACDLRYCTTDASFRMPAARMGLGYDLAGIRQAVNIIGYANVKDIFFTARTFDGAEALRMGFVNMAYEPRLFDDAVGQTLNQIATNAPLTIKAAKQAVRHLSGDAQVSQQDVASAISACFESQDFKEGQQAFKEGRPPIFQGH